MMDFRPLVRDAALVASTAQQALARATAALAAVQGVRSLDRVLLELHNTVMPVQFLRLVAEDDAVRRAAAQAMEDLERFELAVCSNPSVYAALKREQGQELDPETTAAVERYLRECELRGGAHLGHEERAQVNAINNEITTLEAEYQRNIANDATQVAFKREDLAGMDEAFLGALKRDAAGDMLVTLQYPHVQPVLRWATLRETRERMWRANAHKAASTS